MQLGRDAKAVAFAAALLGIVRWACGAECTAELASVRADGGQPNDGSLYSAVSPDGRYVAFSTAATDVVSPDANGSALDVVVRDLELGVSVLASKSSSGVQGNGASERPCLSEGAAFVAFDSLASNLVADDANGVSDVFRHRLSDGTTELVSVNDDGEPGNGASDYASISHDGSRIVFVSAATNLDVAYGATPENVRQVYLREISEGSSRTVLVSRDSNGAAAAADCTFAAISGDGRWVAVAAEAQLIPDLDPNARSDIYLYDLESDPLQPVLVSRASSGLAANGLSGHPALSADGGVVAFDSWARNLAGTSFSSTQLRVFAYFRADGTIRHVSRSTAGGDAGDTAELPSISADGRSIAFGSTAADLVAGDTNGVMDVFLHDLETSKTVRAGLPAGGGQANGESQSIWYALSRDASVLAFRSKASNIVSGATKRTACIYVRRSPGDFDPPVPSCPDPIVAEWTSVQGAVVDFEVAATDACDPAPAVEADPPSGSLFPLGETTVTVTATDGAGNRATCTFTVTVTSGEKFLRGDSNGDARVNVTDAVHILRYLFAGGGVPPCLDAADVDDDGAVCLTDAVYLLQFFARRIDALPDPGPRTPGPDPTPDELGCGVGARSWGL